MLKLQENHLAAIQRHGEQSYPVEACGLLVGINRGDVREVRAAFPCANASAGSPQIHYAIDPAEVARIQRQTREHGWEIVGIYHSHPDHPAMWSPTDLADACWTLCSYVITSIDQGKAVATRSFVLTGTGEDDKAFVAEEIVLE